METPDPPNDTPGALKQVATWHQKWHPMLRVGIFCLQKKKNLEAPKNAELLELSFHLALRRCCDVSVGVLTAMASRHVVTGGVGDLDIEEKWWTTNWKGEPTHLGFGIFIAFNSGMEQLKWTSIQ